MASSPTRENSDREHAEHPGALEVQPAEACGAGEAVEEREAVEHDQRREHREQEVLQRALEPLRVAPAVADQDVRGHRRQLDREHERDELTGLGDQHAAEKREQRERDRLPHAALPTACRPQHPDRGEHAHDDAGEPGRAIEGEHPGERAPGDGERREGRDDCGGEAREAAHPGRAAVGAGQLLGEERPERRQQHEELGYQL